MIKLLTIIPEMIIKTIGFLIKLMTKNLVVSLVVLAIVVGGGWYFFSQTQSDVKSQLLATLNDGQITKEKLASVSAELETIRNTDQVKRNDTLEGEIKKIHDTFQSSITTYEGIQDLKVRTKKPYDDLDKNFADVLKKLSDKDYNGASATLTTLNTNVKTENDKIASLAAAAAAASAPQNAAPATQTTTPPDSGYQRISVPTGNGNFTVDMVGADLNSTKVIVDTASDSDCHDNCPVMPLANYASRSGAYAAIAGPYFCPAAYPSCAGKTNSFDTLLMNKNKHYFNSDNNVYSNVPAAIFSAGTARFVGASQEWGRDTGPDSVIANYPLLIAGGNNVYGGSSDGKLTSKGPRGFIATKGGKVYIGYVLGATTADQAVVLKALGMDQAINLDEGGSTALWVGGKYIEGPGRDLPFGVLLVKR